MSFTHSELFLYMFQPPQTRVYGLLGEIKHEGWVMFPTVWPWPCDLLNDKAILCTLVLG